MTGNYYMAFNQEKALVGAFSVITNLRMEFFEIFRSHYLLHCHSAVFAVCRNIRLGDGLGSGEGVQLRGGAADRDQEA